MKHNQLLIAGLVGAAFAAATTAPAAEPVASGFTFSARVPLNIKARFTGTMAIGPTGGSRTTPNGANYNYDDGYVFNDASGSGDGGTWYWGYDNSASQVDPANHAILMSRTTGAATLSSPEMDDDGALGFELA